MSDFTVNEAFCYWFHAHTYSYTCTYIHTFYKVRTAIGLNIAVMIWARLRNDCGKTCLRGILIVICMACVS